jgi:hypothetical protein
VSDELDRTVDEVEPELTDYFETIDVDELQERVTAWFVAMSMFLDGLERRGVAPSFTRSLRVMVPRVDVSRGDDVDGA